MNINRQKPTRPPDMTQQTQTQQETSEVDYLTNPNDIPLDSYNTLGAAGEEIPAPAMPRGGPHRSPLQFTHNGPIRAGAVAEPRTTRAYQLQPSSKPYNWKPPVTSDGVHQELPRWADEWFLFESEQQGLGIDTEHEDYCYSLNPEIFHNTNGGATPICHTDPVMKHAREISGFRPVLDEFGCLIRNGDQVLCAKPKPDMAALLERDMVAAYEYTDAIGAYGPSNKTFEDPISKTPMQRFTRDPDYLERRREFEHNQMVEHNLIGPTTRVNYVQEARDDEGRRIIENLEAQYRGTRRSDVPPERMADIDALVEARLRNLAKNPDARPIGYDELPTRRRESPQGKTFAVGGGKSTQEILHARGHK